MQKHAGFILALASAAPAVANGAVEPRPIANPAGGVAATARTQGVAAALDEGRALLTAGNAAQAISAFRLALSADQGSVPALNGLAIAYDRLGRSDLARQHFEMALAVQPDAADIAYNLGLTLHLAGDHRAAVPWLQKAAGGNDGRAATAARRVLLVIAARLEAEAAGPPAAAQPLAPTRVASARIDMASSGEAVLVLPGAVAHPAARPAPVLAARRTAAPVLALSVPVAPLAAAALAVSAPDISKLAVTVPVLARDPVAAPAQAPRAALPAATPAAAPSESLAAVLAEAVAATAAREAAVGAALVQAPALAPLPVQEVMARRLGALATLTIPLAAPAAAAPERAPLPIVVTAPATSPAAAAEPASDAAPVQARPISLGLAAPALGDRAPRPVLGVAAAPPLRLLDLAALPLLATATPLQPQPLLAPARLAVDWLSGTDVEAIAPAAEPPAYQRLVGALLAQADLADAVDPVAVRLAINRLEALVARLRSLTSAVAYA